MQVNMRVEQLLHIERDSVWNAYIADISTRAIEWIACIIDS